MKEEGEIRGGGVWFGAWEAVEGMVEGRGGGMVGGIISEGVWVSGGWDSRVMLLDWGESADIVCGAFRS